MYLIEPIRNGEYITDGAIALAMQVYVNQHMKIFYSLIIVIQKWKLDVFKILL